MIATKHRLVMKTALKLLLIFVEYADVNAQKLVNVIKEWEGEQRSLSWSSITSILKDYDNIDTEVLVYATTLINKTLAGLKDQDTFYDETDILEYQGMEGIIQHYTSQPGTDLDLLDQLQLYDMVLKYEDGEIDNMQVQDMSSVKHKDYGLHLVWNQIVEGSRFVIAWNQFYKAIYRLIYKWKQFEIVLVSIMVVALK